MTAADARTSASFSTQHAKVLRLEVSVGKADAQRTLSELEEAVREALKDVGLHNITLQGGYYIIDGKVCLPNDYDPETLNRKPGTYPPTWAGGPSEAERKQTTSAPSEPEDDSPREFVRVKPTRTNERHPTGRRVRSDKGVKRGPKGAAASK